MRRFKVVVALMLLAVAGISGAQKPKANDPQMVEAKRHFDQAVALFNDGDFGAALTEFEASYAIHPAAGVLYNIGLSQKALYRYDEALTSLRKYSSTRKKIPKDKRAEVTQLIGEIQALLATVTFEVAPAARRCVSTGASSAWRRRCRATASPPASTPSNSRPRATSRRRRSSRSSPASRSRSP